jgi:Domain of unknown function (DUF4232)
LPSFAIFDDGAQLVATDLGTDTTTWWSSVDGTTWQRLTLGGAKTTEPVWSGDPAHAQRWFDSVFVVPGGLVVVGSGNGSPSAPGRIWVAAAQTAGFAASGPPVGAVSTCRTSQLAISQVGGGYAAGTVGAYLRFTNLGTQPCQMQGWPTLVGSNASGGTTTARDDLSLLTFPNLSAPPKVLLAPGAAAYAAFASSDTPSAASATCPPAYVTLRITTPGSPDSVTISARNDGFMTSTTSPGYLPACGYLGVTPIVSAGNMVGYLPAPSASP